MARAPRVLKRKEVIRTTNMRAEFGRLFALAFPVAITQIGYMLFGVVDLLIVGRLDTESLSACVLGNSWIGGTMLIGIGIVSGMDPIISQAHGAANCQRLGRTLHRSIVISLLVSIPIVMLWYATENALLFLGQDPGISAYAHEYVVAQVPSLPCFLVFTAFRQYLTGRGILIPALVVVLL
ncbi:MAG: MATE family multidrug resistance protein, partial [Planctomycetota bacterium]